MANGRYVSDVFQGFRGVPHFVVAVTASDRSWVLRATINSELFNSLLQSAEVGPGGDAFIINAKGELQTPSRLGLSTMPREELAALTGTGAPRTLFSRDFIHVAAGVKNNAWLLILKTDIHTSLAEFYRARNRDRLIIAAAALTILMVATLLVRSMVGQIEKADRQRLVMSNRMRQAEKMALVGRLAASVAHEINNPLQIVGDQAGWVEELLEGEGASNAENLAEYRKASAKIREQVKRASTITHRLLGFSRKERERVATDINRVLEESLSFLETEAQKHRISFRKELAAELAPAVTDASQLQQVFLNIINNAIDAIGEDGVITVTTGSAAERIKIEFTDSGPGLPPENLGRIFDPLFTTKELGSGIGLGLSISYNIMQRLGGDIQAGNNSGGGSVFTVHIPAVGTLANSA
jgi:two-component system, NtrC family, sensor kinase